MDEPRRKLILTLQNVIDVANEPHVKTAVLYGAAMRGIEKAAKQSGIALEFPAPGERN